MAKLVSIHKKFYFYGEILKREKINTNPSRYSWVLDFGTTVIEHEWDSRISCSTKSHETQFKIIHKLHVTRTDRSKYDTECDVICKKCNIGKATYFHAFWEWLF